jgi:hypothetical protein
VIARFRQKLKRWLLGVPPYEWTCIECQQTYSVFVRPPSTIGYCADCFLNTHNGVNRESDR